MSEFSGDLLIHALAARAEVRDSPARGRAAATRVIDACGPDDARALAVALRARGWAERELYLYGDSRRSLGRAAAVARRHRFVDLLVEALISRSSLDLEIGRLGAAQRDVDRARATVGGRSTIELECQEALIALKLGHHARAVELGFRARALIDEKTDPATRVVVLSNLAESLSYLGRWHEAEEIFEEEAAVSEQLGAYSYGFSLQVHAAALARGGRLHEALHTFDRAEELLREAGFPLGEYHLDKILSLASLRLLAEAETAARQASIHFVAQGMGALMLPEFRLQEARLHLTAGRHDEAEESATAAAELFRRQRRPGYAAKAEVSRLQAGFRTGRLTTRDLARAKRARATLIRAGAVTEALDADLLLVHLEVALGRTADARARLRHLQRETTAAGSLTRIGTHLAEAVIADADGDGARVARAARRGLTELEHYRATLPTTELRALASAHGVELAMLGLRAALRRNDAVRAIEWIERGRLASILSDPPRPRDDQLDDALGRLRQVAGEQRSTDDLSVITRLRREQTRLEHRIARRLRAVAPDAAAVGNAIELEELESSLAGTLLELVVVQNELIAVTLGPRRRIWRLGDASSVLAEADWLAAALRRLAQAPRNPGAATQAVEASLRTLDRLLIDPVRDALPGDVLVIPPASLFALPWHALPSLRERRVTIAPSGAVWARASRSSAAGKGIVVAAGPRLEAATAEAIGVARCHPAATVLTPPTSTVERVKAALDGARLAHLACHGTFRADNPSFSSLEMCDGPLTLLEIETLGRAPDTVVLASCDSGASQALPGDELRGFLTTLFMLGTRAIVASAVPVPDLETTPVMLALHGELARGRGVGDALRAARAAIDVESPAGLVTAIAFAHFGAD